MKKALLLLLALCVLTLAACRKQQPSPAETAPETVTETVTEAVTETAPVEATAETAPEELVGYEEAETPEE